MLKQHITNISIALTYDQSLEQLAHFTPLNKHITLFKTKIATFCDNKLNIVKIKDVIVYFGAPSTDFFNYDHKQLIT